MSLALEFNIPCHESVDCNLNEKESVRVVNETDEKVALVVRDSLPELLGGGHTFDIKLNGRVVSLGEEGLGNSSYGTFFNSVFFQILPPVVASLFPNVSEHIREGDVAIQEKDSNRAQTVMIVQASGEGETVVPRWHS